MPQDPPRTPARPARVCVAIGCALLALLVAATLVGCSDRRRARAELERQRIALDKEAYLEAVERADAATVRLFLRAGLGLPGGLVTASWHGHCELLGELLAGGVDAGGLPGAEALVRARGRGQEECARRLLEAGASLDAAAGNGETLLIKAARQSEPPARMRRLLELGADPLRTTKAGTTALMHAAAARRGRSVRMLLAAGSDVAARDLDGWTALHFAARAGNVAASRMLLRAGADADAESDLGWTPLQLAARAGSRPVVELLLEAGVAVDRASHAGQTALIQAVRDGHAGVATALLEAGADPAVEVGGVDAVWWARLSRSRAIAALRARLEQGNAPAGRAGAPA